MVISKDTRPLEKITARLKGPKDAHVPSNLILFIKSLAPSHNHLTIDYFAELVDEFVVVSLFRNTD